MPKHLILANDLAGTGKVALSSSLVVMASCQIETSLLPTVILSSHTGGFSDVYIEDDGHQALQFLKQWENETYPSQGILTGYLKSEKLVDAILDFATKKRIPLIVDPIMGDRGKLYQGFNQQQIKQLRRLAQSSELLLPNLTEAAFLTGKPYLGDTYSSADVEALLLELANLGPEQIMITGVSFKAGELGVAYYNAKLGQFSFFVGPAYPQHFFGTGDLFTSIVTAYYVHGLPLEAGIQRAIAFIGKAIESTLALERELKYGLYFEPHLADLMQEVRQLMEEKDD